MLHLYGNIVRKRVIRFCFLLLAYSTAIVFTLWLSYELRFDFHVPQNFAQVLTLSLGWIVLWKLAVLLRFGQFQDSLSYFSTPDLRRIVGVCVVSSFGLLVVYQLLGLAVAPPRGVILTDGILSCVVLCGGRATLRFVRERFLAPQTRPEGQVRRVGIVGAGDAGATLARELMANRWLGLRPIAFFDDNRAFGSRLHGIPVWGAPERLLDAKIGLKLDEVIIAFPSAAAERRREVVKILQQTKLPFRTIPSMTELAMGTGEVSNLRPVQIEDLLGREVVKMDTTHIRQMIEGSVVLVTGAGGSIGSELCRQIASFGPRSLLLVERSEAALFPIEQELIERGCHHLVVPLVADVTDLNGMADIFATHQPQAVFHAAAHKHVPLMESQPAEAIRNNILGTAQLAELAYAFGVERFLLISSDKAINPTSVMGATKRMAEITVQSMQGRDRAATKFMAVRFGNVLGSSGSVVPIFARQIAAGGPVKVTHPEVTRFFMTIPEAVSLVLQSAALARGGEIFVLDMGKPIKIADLARQMIELSGLKPDRDIQIEFTGLRPGEKLYEELSHEGEDIATTEHEKIRRLVCDPQPFPEVETVLRELASAISVAKAGELKALLKRLIPEYTPEFAEAEAANPADQFAPHREEGGNSEDYPDAESGSSGVLTATSS
jgi:FlaA1/EpsC-like NDP-sugar epimerase